MSNCLTSLARGICGTAVVLLRIILFILCVSMIFIHTINLWALYNSKIGGPPHSKFGFEIHTSDYLKSIVLIIVATVGAHGAFTKSAKYLKLFALIVAVYSIANSLLILSTISSTDWPKVEKNFTTTLRKYADDYQWNMGPHDEPNEATKTWDFVQRRLFCCGLDKPEDWLEWRHDKSKHPEFPRSCCLTGFKSCGRDEVFPLGCEESFKANVEFAFARTVASSIGYLILALMALIIAKHGECCSESHYQRFEGSVYVRQSASNPVYQVRTIDPFGKQQPPSYYPSLLNEFNPPPRYTN